MYRKFTIETQHLNGQFNMEKIDFNATSVSGPNVPSTAALHRLTLSSFIYVC